MIEKKINILDIKSIDILIREASSFNLLSRDKWAHTPH